MSSDCRVSSSHYWSTLRLPAAVLVHDLAVVDRQGRDLEVNIRYHEDTQAGQSYEDRQYQSVTFATMTSHHQI